MADAGGMSGIKLTEDIVTFYNNEFKLKKQHAFFTLKIAENFKEVVLDFSAEPYSKTAGEEEWKDRFKEMLTKLDKKEPLFVVHDFRYISADKRHVDDLICICWSPDEGATIKRKMIFASTKNNVTKKLNGVIEIQANDLGDVEYDSVREKLIKMK